MKQITLIISFLIIILSLSSRNRNEIVGVNINDDKQELKIYSEFQKGLYSCFLKKENLIGPMLDWDKGITNVNICRPYPLIFHKHIVFYSNFNDTLKYNPINDTIIWDNNGSFEGFSASCEMASTIDTISTEDCFESSDRSLIKHENFSEKFHRRKIYERIKNWGKDDFDSIFIEKDPEKFSDGFEFIGRAIIKNNEIVDLKIRRVDDIEYSRLNLLQ